MEHQDDRRLSDRISIGVLTRVYPPAVVDAAVEATGKVERRHRLLPARVTMYYVLAMGLFKDASYQEVMRFLGEGLAWQDGNGQSWQVPTKAAIVKARRRLGSEPLRALYEGCVRPLASTGIPAAWLRQWRLMSMDTTWVAVVATDVNEAAFGRPRPEQGYDRGRYPQMRLTGLVEHGTHAIVGAAMGPAGAGSASAPGLLCTLGPGVLCIADRRSHTHESWAEGTATGADLLWRVDSDCIVGPYEPLGDRSHLACLSDPAGRCHPVRVIDPTGVDQAADPLITTITDPVAAPADELTAAYAQRTRIQSVLDELNPHPDGGRLILRSRDPDGIYQEAYGHLLAHYAVRSLMHRVGLAATFDIARVSR